MFTVSQFCGCSPPHDAGAELTVHERPDLSVTLWTEKVELFMEYPALVAGKESEFLAHVTTLADFKPVTEGALTLTLKDESGVNVYDISVGPAREGIFMPVMTPAEPGIFQMEIALASQAVSDLIPIGKVTIHHDMRSMGEAFDDERGDTGGGLISFLKEQQWKLDFHTEQVRLHDLRRTVRAVGEIRPKLQNHSEIVSPVEGIILAERNHFIPAPGSEVEKGRILASISPSPDAERGWTAVKLGYDQARIEFERARSLYEKMAIPEKLYQEALWEYQTRKSSYESLLGERVGDGNVDASHFQLKAPISGIVAEVSFVPGQRVSAGQKMFTIINPAVVWLSVRVPERDIHLITETSGASFEPVGSKKICILDSTNSELLSINDIVDPATRTVEVIFEILNPERTLKVGQFVRVALNTDDNLRDIAVPESALYDEGGWHAVYVQKEGEAFEKRKVETGVRYRGLVQVEDGLSIGERVVIVGGYQVKLASSTSEAGHGHAH